MCAVETWTKINSRRIVRGVELCRERPKSNPSGVDNICHEKKFQHSSNPKRVQGNKSARDWPWATRVSPCDLSPLKDSRKMHDTRELSAKHGPKKGGENNHEEDNPTANRCA